MQKDTTGPQGPGRLSYVEIASSKINGFAALMQELKKRLTINGRVPGTYQNYSRHLAHLALYYGKNPIELNADEVIDYLYELKSSKEVSKSFFNFTVFGMRAICQMRGLAYENFQLPVIPHKKRLPVVLNSSEAAALIKAASKPKKNGLLIATMIDCGLRLNEIRNLEVTHIDLERRTLHVHQGKRSKDRVVFLGEHLTSGLSKYLEYISPEKYLFEGSRAGSSMSAISISTIIKSAAKAAGIKKEVSAHTLRHTCATTMLEHNVPLPLIQKALGHSNIQTTMIYLHVANCSGPNRISPVDVIIGKK
jgi:integrase